MRSKERRLPKWKPGDSVEDALNDPFRREIRRRYDKGKQVCVYCGRSRKDCAEVKTKDFSLGRRGFAVCVLNVEN